MLDISIAYQRYRFIGDEFLTWLWFTIENEPGLFRSVDPDCTALEIGNRIVLENRKTKSIERITIKGDDAGLEEGRVALRKGALVSEMVLLLKTGEYQWEFALKAETLSTSNLRVPGPSAPQSPEQMDEFILERYEFIYKIIKFIENSFAHFIRLRISTKWSAKHVQAIRKWMKSTQEQI
jgi:hypothetical protein